VAVEGDRPDRPDPSAAGRGADGDQTRLKPVSAVSGSAPHDVARPAAPPAPAAGGRSDPTRTPISSTVWWTVAAVVLVVLAGGLVWRAASSGDPTAAPGVTAPTTHDTAVPGVVPRPIVTAHRAGGQVVYRWHTSDAPQPGDSYEWRVPSQGGGSHLTNGTTTTVTGTGRVCLQVRLERTGLPPSTWASACA
jgi:hypothetical protein